MRRAFTLVELLVVVTIIGLITIAALASGILSGVQRRGVSEGARLLQASLAGARDAAIRDNAPSGVRLLPDPAFPLHYLPSGQLDPAFPLAYNRIIPVSPAPGYQEGLISQWQGTLPTAVAALPWQGPGTPAIPNPTYGQTSALMVYESVTSIDPVTKLTYPNSPTSWFWNIRIGEKIQLNNAGKWYTIIGPMVVTPAQGNGELFVNVGPPGTVSPFKDANGVPMDFLLLVNSRDDNADGYVDNGWDGIDNDGINGVDDIGEWIETETW